MKQLHSVRRDRQFNLVPSLTSSVCTAITGVALQHVHNRNRGFNKRHDQTGFLQKRVTDDGLINSMSGVIVFMMLAACATPIGLHIVPQKWTWRRRCRDGGNAVRLYLSNEGGNWFLIAAADLKLSSCSWNKAVRGFQW